MQHHLLCQAVPFFWYGCLINQKNHFGIEAGKLTEHNLFGKIDRAFSGELIHHALYHKDHLSAYIIIKTICLPTL
jgi:hypothetical protein